MLGGGSLARGIDLDALGFTLVTDAGLMGLNAEPGVEEPKLLPAAGLCENWLAAATEPTADPAEPPPAPPLEAAPDE